MFCVCGLFFFCVCICVCLMETCSPIAKASFTLFYLLALLVSSLHCNHFFPAIIIIFPLWGKIQNCVENPHFSVTRIWVNMCMPNSVCSLGAGRASNSGQSRLYALQINQHLKPEQVRQLTVCHVCMRTLTYFSFVVFIYLS